ncbi:uncharacterized protein BcabD6B2_51900 [Babesia caballi]|uniref:Membrane protein, putative n=1 Tax=Babesia caballi TaxID=5871 RepID=A0AAV4M0L3_BABCB|nr:membrane protein, putative [Babesia caballi]
MGMDDFSFGKRGDHAAWIDNEMPLGRMTFFSSFFSSFLGGIVGIVGSLVVNCALVEISTSPFFTLYFAFTFIVIGLVILWRLSVSTVDADTKHRKYLRYFGLMILASGFMCFFLRQSWFARFPLIVKLFVYTLLGLSISFALTFTIVDLVNYFMSMFETSIARPLVESKPQVLVILCVACVMGGVFGFVFGLIRVEDEAEYHVKLALMKEESYTWPVGAILGSAVGCKRALRVMRFRLGSPTPTSGSRTPGGSTATTHTMSKFEVPVAC